MQLRIGSSAPGTDAIVLPTLKGGALPHEAVPAAEIAGFNGAVGASCEVRTAGQLLLLVGVGLAADEAAYRAAGALAVAKLGHLRRIALDARHLPASLAAAFALGAMLRSWTPPQDRKHAAADAPRLNQIHLLSIVPGIEAAWGEAEAVYRGAALARDLVALPSNLITPDGFIEQLAPLRKAGVSITVLKRRELQRQGLGALLAVGRGSAHRPRLAILRWPGAIEAAPVVFVGKGITFDTGGICIKPADKMWEMRADMAGAAAAAGAIYALALRGSPAPACAVLALAENATGGDSYRPGDVLTTYNGKTVEVIDTDAEGRLVLADALAYAAARLKPQAVIDLATLTGSIVIALGHRMAGLFGNDPALAAHIAAAGEMTDELVWRMPMAEGYRKALDSDIADIANCAKGRYQPDACHAAAFLAEFAGDAPWAHLDIAGVESCETADDQHAAGATGFGVRLLDRLVATRFEDPHRA
jgi:leucyl aminopeptidase